MKSVMEMEEFVVDTSGHCFLCLNQIQLVSEQSISVHSIQYLSKYLKLDMRKIFQDPIPQNLLAKVERSTLKVELCSECCNLNEKLTKLFEQLQRIEMEIDFRLNSVHEKISNSQMISTIKQVRRKIDNENDEVSSGKLEIAQILRDELNSKCLMKNSNINPRIRIERTKWGKTGTDFKMEEKSFESIAVISEQVKLEKSSHPTDEESDNNDDFLDSDMIHQEEGSWHSDSSTDSNFLRKISAKKRNMRRKSKARTSLSKLKGQKFQIKNKIKDKSLAVNVPPAIKSAERKKPDSITNQRVINPKNGKHKCRMCSKEYSALGSFYLHFKSVHIKVCYTCPVTDCREIFSRKDLYEIHYKKLHLHIRYKCQLCRSTFAQKPSLHRHVKTLHQNNKTVNI